MQSTAGRLGYIALLLLIIGGTARTAEAQVKGYVYPSAHELADSSLQTDQPAQVEILPALRRSDRAIQAELLSTLELPRSARGMEAGGRGLVRFVVDTSGTVTEVTVVQGWKFIGIDRAVTKAIRTMEFTPGRQGHRPVPVVMYLPLRIQGF